jgi:hypothetical protein
MKQLLFLRVLASHESRPHHLGTIKTWNAPNHRALTGWVHRE